MQQQQPQRPVDPHHVPGQHVLVADWHLQEKSAVHFQGLVSERVDGEEAPSGDRGSPYRPSPSWSSDEAARITSNFAGERQNVAGRTVDNEGCSNDSSLYSSVVTLAAPAARQSTAPRSRAFATIAEADESISSMSLLEYP
eukprot:CAMPEP_0184224758 /NCGR_PEP_ID=MMETSP0976-20121227/19904_1 /TAXON_ID=483370 /ORGANISM="non described non described, Strain CCMP2097" /LENGTH=140 /DNA_ID=CAMNT_0026529691 /DNA_START=177 /DNA_END=601 /DNA_ORIENTATION=+